MVLPYRETKTLETTTPQRHNATTPKQRMINIQSHTLLSPPAVPQLFPEVPDAENRGC
jgi:hypothetical protein